VWCNLQIVSWEGECRYPELMAKPFRDRGTCCGIFRPESSRSGICQKADIGCARSDCRFCLESSAADVSQWRRECARLRPAPRVSESQHRSGRQDVRLAANSSTADTPYPEAQG